MIFRQCECCAEASDCVHINHLYLCEKCVRAFDIEWQSHYIDEDLKKQENPVGHSIEPYEMELENGKN